MQSETILTVRYAETDRMGIVHHSVYPVWFEAGRTDLIKLAGVRYSDLEKRGILLPLLSMKVIYKNYADYEDTITVTTSVKSLSYTRIVFEYKINKNKVPDIIASGETEHAFTDAGLRPFNLRKRNPDIYGVFEGYAQDGDQNRG